MNRICMVLACAAALLLTGCFPVSTSSPVGSTRGFKPDPRLYGVWRNRNPRDKGSITNFFKKDNNAMMLIMTDTSMKKHGGEVEAYTVHVARLGANHFMNMNMFPDASANDDDAKDIAERNTALLYMFRKNGDLVFYKMDEKRVRAAIRTGRITGKIDPDDNRNGSHIKGDVHIIADAASTDAFMQSAAGLALYKNPIAILEKISGH